MSSSSKTDQGVTPRQTGVRFHGPLSAKEALIALLLLSLGRLIAYLLDIDFYNTISHGIEAILFSTSFLIGLIIYRLWSQLFVKFADARWAAAIWGLVSWYGLGLSYFAYIGYGFILIEVILSAIAIAWRAQARFVNILPMAIFSRFCLLAWEMGAIYLLKNR